MFPPPQMAESHPKRLDVSPLFVALLGVMIGAVMLTIYHCIIVGWCIRNRTLTGTSQPHQGIRRRRDEDTPSSLEHSMVELLPVQRYRKESKEDDEAMCAVCLAEFKEGEEVRVLPECTHKFHVACIDMWLFSHANCPLCRTDTTPPQRQPDPEGPGLPEFPRLPNIGG